MALNVLFCGADVPLTNYSLAHSLTFTTNDKRIKNKVTYRSHGKSS